MTSSPAVWTIGHSTRSIEEFIEALASHGVTALADVRRFPMSRHCPHFNQGALAASLEKAGIQYVAHPELGGRREPLSHSRNTGLRNPAFRGYADYMETAPFRHGVERLLRTARERRVAVMCAEALWWKCHRSLIADYLKANGHDVFHITGVGDSQPHPYTPAAHIEAGRLSYAPVEEPVRRAAPRRKPARDKGTAPFAFMVLESYP